MRHLFFLPLLFPLLSFAVEPLYTNDFQAAEVGTTPKDFLVIAGVFSVQKIDANQVLELPGEPLDTFGLLFGPAAVDGLSASVKCFGTKTGRKFPTFGISLNGAGGWRLQVSPAKKAVELLKGDEVRQSAPFTWESGAWTQLRIAVRKTSGGSWVIEGRAWPASAPEPAQWLLSQEEKSAPASGRPGLWASPYSGTPIHFDDLVVTPAS